MEVSTTVPAPGFPPLVRERLRVLGLGKRVLRVHLEQVCGGYSAANHFLDAASKNGLLIPVAWGEYHVADAATLDLLARIPLAPHRRLVSWAKAIPRLTARRKIAFFAPRLWRETELSIEEPAPILQLDPSDRAIPRPPPQWGAFLYDLQAPETWKIMVGADEAARIFVPNVVDSLVLMHANADPRWRAASALYRTRLPKADVQAAQEILASLWRSKPPKPVARMILDVGPPLRRRLVPPAWYQFLHEAGLEVYARGLPLASRTN